MTDDLTEACAQIAVLREALEEIRQFKSASPSSPLRVKIWVKQADGALAATPSDCYAQIRAEVLEKAAKYYEGKGDMDLTHADAIRALKDKP